MLLSQFLVMLVMKKDGSVVFLYQMEKNIELRYHSLYMNLYVTLNKKVPLKTFKI